MKDLNWSEEMVETIQKVSDDLPRDAVDLFEEDSESLTVYLRSEAFLDDLLENDDPLSLDPKLLFFVLFEQFKRKIDENPDFQQEMASILKETGSDIWPTDRTFHFFEDEKLIDYLTDMLNTFVHTDQVYQLPGKGDDEYQYVFEMLEAAQDSSDTEAFQIFCHIGNYSLYLTGIFPEWIRYRHEYKNRPMDVESYRNYGKTFFDRASKHRLAKRNDLQPVLSKLSEGYDLVRSSIELIFTRILPAFK